MYRRGRGRFNASKYAGLGPYRRANYRARRGAGARYAARSVMRTGGNYNQILLRPVTAKMAYGQGPEKKYLDTQLAAGCYVVSAAAGSTGAGTFTLLNGLTQGAGGSERLGRQFTIRSIGMNMYVEPGATTVPGLLRTIVFFDTQANGVAPTDALLLEAGAVTGYATSHLAMTSRERFKIIFDKRHAIGDKVVNQSNGPAIVHQEKFRKLNVVVTNTGGAGNTVAEIQTNSLYVVTYTTCLTLAPVCSTRFRIRYTDA